MIQKSGALEGLVVVTVNDELAEVMARHVDSMGGQGIAFRSLHMARAYLSTHPDGIDCAVVDLLLGNHGDNGADLIRELRLTHPSLPCVLVSGYSLDRVQQEALRGVGFLQKPFQAHDLAAKILEAIGASEREKRG